MAGKSIQYKESLYQWIWQNLEFDCQHLETVCGKPIRLINQGIINRGAGPDFLGAAIEIDQLIWHGAVEIHRNTSDWVKHSHHNDSNYDRVFLHVVFEHDLSGNVNTTSGKVPYTLCLRPYLHRSLWRLSQIKENKGLACAGNPVIIHQDAFRAQLKKANSEYFSWKVEELMKDYPAGIPLSEAWKVCVTLRMYHTLGISSNRQQMWKLGKKAIEINTGALTAEQFAKRVKEIAFSGLHGIDADEWVSAGMRPASHPDVRAEQAACLHHACMALSLRSFLDHPEEAWEQLTGLVPARYRPGQTMLGILRQTVMIPAMYLLGDLLHATELKKWAFEQWNSFEMALPYEVKKPFIEAGFTLDEEKKMPGLAHQLKRYCMVRSCHHCEVFKNAIGS